jgi:DNA gyrase subunit A
MYETGRGLLKVRGRAGIEEGNARGPRRIIITEIPYAVNKATLIEKIADLVNDKKIDGISDIRDESDKDGIRIVVELKRGAIPRWCSTTSTSTRSWRAPSARSCWRSTTAGRR